MPELTPIQKQRLQDELVRYAKEGATDDDLRAFKNTLIAQFEEQNTSVKKKDIGQLGAKAVAPGTENTSQSKSQLKSTLGQASSIAGSIDSENSIGQNDQFGNMNPMVIEPDSVNISTSEENKGDITSYLQGLKKPAELIKAGNSEAVAQAIDLSKSNPLLQVNKDGSRQKSMKESIAETQEKINQDKSRKIAEIQDAIYDGSASMEDIAKLYDYDEAKPFLTSYLNAYSDKDKLPQGDVLIPGEHWKSAWKNSSAENRPIAVKKINDYTELSDKVISGLSGTKINIPKILNGNVDIFERPLDTDELEIPQIDSNNPTQLALLIQKIEQSVSLVSPSGDISDKRKDILSALYFKLDAIKRTEKIDPEIDALDEKIYYAIGDIENAYNEITAQDPNKRQYNTDDRKTTAFKRGLNYIKDTDRPTYLNVVKGISDKGEIAEVDYQYILSKGESLENATTFIAGAENKDLIGAETKFNLETKSSRVAKTSAVLGEFFKQQGITTGHFSDDQIDYAAKKINWTDIGLKPPTEKELDFIKAEEDRLFYDQIPKNGGLFSLIKGFEKPFLSIARTVSDMATPSSADIYLRSKELGRAGSGGMLTPDKDGKYGERLGSDRGNIWYDVLDGAGQFIPQILLTKGIGTPFASAAESIVGNVSARAALTSEQLFAINTATGTMLSSYLQSYGDGYEQALQKTGDIGKAEGMAVVGAIVDGVMEQWLPETKIGRSIVKNLRGDISEKIVSIIRKGGSPSELLEATKGVLKPFVAEYLNVTGQEMAEEGSAVLLKQLSESIISPETAAKNDVMGDLANTLWSTAVQTFVPAIGSGGAMAKNRFTKKVFNTAAINIDYTKDILKQSLIKGTVSQEEYNKSLSLLNTHNNNIAVSPKFDTEGKRIPAKQRVEYAYQQTDIKINEEKIKNDNISDVEKEFLKKKIEDAKEIQRGIYSGTDIVEDEQTKVDDNSKKIFTDFDNTLWNNKTQSLTPFGEEMKAKIAAGEDVTVLTSRESTDENENFIAEKLGLPLSKVVSGLSPQGKAGKLLPGSTFYDDNEENIKAAKSIQGVNVVDSKQQVPENGEQISQPIELDPNLPEGYIEQISQPIELDPNLPEEYNLLTKLREKASNEQKNYTIQDFVDKAGEDPAHFIEVYGPATANNLLKRIPTEKLIENRDYIVKNFGESDASQYLTNMIDKRVKDASEMQVADELKNKQQEEIDAASRPEVSLNFIADEAVLDSKIPFEVTNSKGDVVKGNFPVRKMQNKIQEKMSNLDKIINCIYGG